MLGRGWMIVSGFVGRIVVLGGMVFLLTSSLTEAATMQPMDLTTFTEVDAGGNITVTANAVAFSNIETRKSISYVYKPQTHPGDFLYEFDAIVTAADTSAGPFLIWGVTNSAAKTYDNWSDGFFLAFNKTSSGMSLRFLDSSGDYESASSFALNTRYYFRVSRAGIDITAKVYTDSGRTVLKATLVRNAVDDDDTILYNNLYVFATDDSVFDTRKATGDVRNLAIQTAGQPGPSAPVLNSATAGNAKVTLAWGAVTGATGYKVKYGTASGSYPTTVDVGNVTTKDVTGLTNGQAYYFVVTAYNANGESGVSNEKSATPVVPPLPDQTAVITDVLYNAAGQITKLTYGNGTVIDYTYNPLSMRLTNLKTTAPGGTVIQDLSYTYDSVGNILSIADAVNTADQTFEYDHLNRLTKATGQTYGAKSYVYDEIGNIVSKEGVSYVYGENAGPHAVTHLSDGTAFTYDANGNMATKVKAGVTTVYAYDAENRLLNIKKNGALVSEYEYDGDGGRTKKKVYGATSTVTTEFIGSLFEKEDGHVSRHVFFGDKKVATVKDGTLVYTFNDHLGGANVVTDASGAVKEIAEYTPFGTFARHDRQGSTDLTQNFFTGQRFDPEDGLYYYGARYYSPEIGRFITPDTIVQAPKNPQTLNRYIYCGNNPLNFVDPSGHWFFAALVAIVKAVTAAAVAHPVIAGAIVGGACGGIQSYQATGTVSPFSIGMGAVMGGLAGGTLGMSGAGLAKIGQAGFLLKASAGFSLASQVMGAAGLDDVSQGFQYASMGLGAAFVGYNIGIGIRDWAASNGTFYDVQSGSVLSKNELASRYGRGGAKVFTNGISQSQGDALAMAAEKNANVLFYNPTSGSIADLTESLLGKMTFTESLSRQLAGVSLHNAAYIGYSQGSIITSNALLGMVHNGGRGVAAGSSVTMLAPAVSQARVYFSAYEAGIQSIGYQAKVFDIINVAGPNLSPINFIGGTIGATTTYGLKVHTSY